MGDMRESCGMLRIERLCQAPQVRALYEHRPDGLHYWLHTHCGRVLVVDMLGSGHEIKKLTSHWVFLETRLHFDIMVNDMAKIHPSQYDKQQEVKETFHKGMRGVFKFPKRPRMCKYCRTTGLFWRDTPQGFRLHTREGEVHTCPATADLY